MLDGVSDKNEQPFCAHETVEQTDGFMLPSIALPMRISGPQFVGSSYDERVSVSVRP
jgi:hypothetical protein